MDDSILRMLLVACAIAFSGTIATIGGIIAWIANRSAKQLEKLTESVNELNIKVAQIIGSVKITESELLDHKRRIEKLETKGVRNGIAKSRSRSI